MPNGAKPVGSLRSVNAPGVVAATCAAVPNDGFQPLITPASEEKRKRAGTPLRAKPLPPLNTVPVGAPWGIVTTSGTIEAACVVAFAPEYSVDRPVPLSAIHAGVVGPNESPHALTRLGSVISAAPGVSATRLRWWKPDSLWALATDGSAATRTTATSADHPLRRRAGHGEIRRDARTRASLSLVADLCAGCYAASASGFGACESALISSQLAARGLAWAGAGK